MEKLQKMYVFHTEFDLALQEFQTAFTTLIAAASQLLSLFCSYSSITSDTRLSKHSRGLSLAQNRLETTEGALDRCRHETSAFMLLLTKIKSRISKTMAADTDDTWEITQEITKLCGTHQSVVSKLINESVMIFECAGLYPPQQQQQQGQQSSLHSIPKGLSLTISTSASSPPEGKSPSARTPRSFFSKPTMTLPLVIEEQLVNHRRKYRIHEALGDGSFARTFRVTPEENEDKSYVLKRIGCATLADANNAIHEALTLAAFADCPEICKYRDFYLDPVEEALPSGHVFGPQALGDTAYLFEACIIMDYYSGGDLDGIIQKEAKLTMTDFELKRTLKWAVQIATAIHAIHKRGKSHRDIKPGNIFLTSDMDARLGDFGTIVDGPASTTIGTKGYMAPEIGTSLVYTSACDIWSFGCLLLDLLTRRRVSLQLKSIDTVLLDIPSYVPSSLSKIITDCLEIDPSKRPTAEQLLDRLKALLVTKLVSSK